MIANLECHFLAVILSIISISISRLNAIKCYKCSYTTPWYYTNETVRLCKNFDYSDEFIEDCPFSTFCIKKTFTARISTLINGTERSCAQQRNETQIYKDGHWQPQVSISEIYSEGCIREESKGVKSAIEYICYCEGSLCNNANSFTNFNNINLLSVIVLPNILLKILWQ